MNLKIGTDGLPAFEKFWREWRQSDEYKVYYDRIKNTKLVLDYYKLGKVPDRVVVPHAALMVGDDHNDEMAIAKAIQAQALFSYRTNKQYLYVDPSLVDVMTDVKWPGTTPAKALLRAPSHSMVVVIPGREEPYFIYFDISAKNKSEVDLIITKYKHNDPLGVGVYGVMSITMNDEPLEAAISSLLDTQTLDYLREFVPDMDVTEDTARVWVENQVRLIVNILLYTAGNDDIVQIVGHKFPKLHNKLSKKINRGHLPRFDFRDPEIWMVGVKIGATIKKYADTQRLETLPTGLTKRPHIRRAHPHLYWVKDEKTGEKVQVVRYLLPISVKGADIEAYLDQITLHKVV